DEGVRIRVVVPEDVLEQEGAPRAEHAVDLTDGRADVGEVVRRDPARDGVERAVAKWERVHVAGGERDIGGAPAPDEVARNTEHGFRQVEGDDLARDGGERERRVAAARRDVERGARAARAAPRQDALEVVAPGVAAARGVVRGTPDHLLLQPASAGLD